MSHTSDQIDDHGPAGSFLPVDPFNSLKVHFGQLLGVEDFQTIDAYHRGKMWIHNGWLHGEGVIWGLDVKLEPEHDQLRVGPGLATDKIGRELYLGIPFCLNVPAWYKINRDQLEVSDVEGGIKFDAHITIRFKSCLTRQVPALVEPCQGSDRTTAYSRIHETVELRMEPGLSQRPQTNPYHRLRLLFNLDPPQTDGDGHLLPREDEIITRRNGILASPLEDQPGLYLSAFKEFAALDVIDLSPGEGGLLPGDDPSPMVLADLKELTLSGDDASGYTLKSGECDPTVRPSHVATRTIQELLCGPLFREPEVADGDVPIPVEPGPGPEPDVDVQHGPRIERASVEHSIESGGDTDRHVIMFNVLGPVLESSLDPPSISVSTFDEAGGWVIETIETVNYIQNEGQEAGQVIVTLSEVPAGERFRLIVRGRGPTPVLGINLIPFAGATGGPAGTEHDGHDFVHIFT